MKLSVLLRRVKVLGDPVPDISVTGVSANSRYTERGNLFIAVPDSEGRWEAHVREAVEKGAAALLCEKKPHLQCDVPVILCRSCRAASSFIYSEQNGNPQQSLVTVGITGTNGKTSTSAMLYSIMKCAGIKCGVIGTLGSFADGEKINIGQSELESDSAQMTTPDPKYLFGTLKAIKDAGCTHCIIEVSSHALALHKADAIDFDLGILTNFARDHLDFHKTAEEYYRAKCRLASQSRTALAINNGYGEGFVRNSSAGGLFCLIEKEENTEKAFGTGYKDIPSAKSEYIGKTNPESNIDIIGRNIFYGEITKGKNENYCGFTLIGSACRIEITVPQRGRIPMYNSLCAASAAILSGIDEESIKKGISSFKGVSGRGEKVLDAPPYPTVIIDYAHTSAALEMLLCDMKEAYGDRRIVLVFGAGGEREREKRAEMGRIACRYADFTYITNDNPRGENPIEIIRMIESGFDNKSNYTVIPDRETAIIKAVTENGFDSVVLLAGKGHEGYIIDKNGKHCFSEKEAVKKAIAENKRS